MVCLPIGEADRARLAQQAELGHLASLEFLADRGGGIDVDGRSVARGAQHVLDQRDVVDDRIGVRHHHDRGDAAGGGRLAGRVNGFAVLRAGLADEDA